MELEKKIRHVNVEREELAICWLGQAGFLLKDGQGHRLVIDPYLTNCGERIRGFKRLSPILLRPEELETDYYIVTHMHFDHFDYEAIPKIARRPKPPLFLGPTSCQEKLREIGLTADRRYRLDRGDVYQDEAVKIHGLWADHADLAPDAIGALVEIGGYKIYFSGDTAFHEELFSQVSEYKPDIAVLSINGKFGNMDAAEGAEAARLCGVKYAIPCHFWTFAEHGGDPGAFCARLQEDGVCIPLCFRQGEIQIMNKHHEFQCRKESA